MESGGFFVYWNLATICTAGNLRYVEMTPPPQPARGSLQTPIYCIFFETWEYMIVPYMYFITVIGILMVLKKYVCDAILYSSQWIWNHPFSQKNMVLNWKWSPC